VICYFGRDDQGFYVDHESGAREYLPEALWREFVAAGAHAGADTAATDKPNAQRVRLSITEQASLQKFEGDQLIETVLGSSETTIL
jgi:hypothetical protein